MPELRLRGGEVDGLALHYLVEGRGPAVVLVHGLGGFAASWRHNIPSLAARATVYAVDLPGFGWQPGWRARLMATPGLGNALARCGCAPLYRAAIARCFHAPPADEVAFLVGWEYATRTTAAARRAWLRTVRSLAGDFVERRADYRRAITTLDVPVLLVHGRQDPAIPAAHCAETAEGFARGSVRWLDACGHFPHIEHAQVVNGWLADFLVGRTATR